MVVASLLISVAVIPVVCITVSGAICIIGMSYVTPIICYFGAPSMIGYLSAKNISKSIVKHIKSPNDAPSQYDNIVRITGYVGGCAGFLLACYYANFVVPLLLGTMSDL